MSTKRQADDDISVPDQLDRCDTWIEAQGCVKVASFVDGGASATTDDRPEFLKMIEAATSDARPFQIILVRSRSWLFRNAPRY